MSPVVVLMSVGTATEGRRLADALVREKWAACVTIVPGVRSIYAWKGKVEGAQEHLLLAKTRRALLPRLMARVRSLHSYDVPEVLVLPVVGGNPTYLSWLNRETKAKTRRKNPTPHQKKASL